jgi:small subunit ribosomal protein S1
LFSLQACVGPTVEEAAVMSFDDNRGSALADGTTDETVQAPAPEILNSTEDTQLNLHAAEVARAATHSGSDAVAATPPSDTAEIHEMLESIDGLSAIVPGEVVPATIVKITDTEVVIDVGLKCEAAIPRTEFLGRDGQITVARGDAIQVFVEQYNEKNGTLRASYQKAAFRRVWDEIEQAHRDQKTIPGKVISRTKGGVTVDVGIPAFLPGSQVDLRPHPNVDALIGQQIDVKVIKVNRERNNAVVSRRQVLEEELAARKAKLGEKLFEGAILTGHVKNLTDYGVFVDLGGMDGLLHVTDLSWGRVGKPSEVVQTGQELRVKVLKYDPEKGRVSLGLKQLSPDPWNQAVKTYQPGSRATGRVVGVVDYGVFVELEPGVEGLIHSSEMSWSKRHKHPSKMVKVGDRVEVNVLDLNPAQRRISLSLKQTLADPWTTLPGRMAAGTVVEGRVRNMTEFGAFVEIEEGIDGLVHISNMSWAKDIKHPSEVLKKGQKVEVVILGMDPEKRRISLALKQTGPDAWTEFCSRVKTGGVVRGTVARLAAFGAFVEIEPGIEGLCHSSEVDTGKKGGSLALGDEYNFCILRMSPSDKKVALSMKQVAQEPAPAAAQKPAAEEPPASAPGTDASTASQET